MQIIRKLQRRKYLLYSSAKYDRPRLFYTPNYYYLPKWVVDHEKLTLLQAVKIINYRMKNNDSDN